MEQFERLLSHHYDLAGSLSRLPGENCNILLETADRQRFVLKVAGEDLTDDAISLEHAVVEHLVAAGTALDLPRIVPTRSGAILAREETAGGPVLRARLLRFVPGQAWVELGAALDELRRELGRILGTVACTLGDFSHPAARRSHRWDLSAASRHRATTGLVTDPGRRHLLERMFHLYEAGAVPALAQLPRSVIHGDVNDENIQVVEGRVAGLLDFGDCLENPTVCELAIALAYIMLDQEEPLAAAAEVVAGYHANRPLESRELAVLYPLVCGRLAVSVAVAAERRRDDPDHPNWFVTEERAWSLLERLAAIEPVTAGRALAAAIDAGPVTAQLDDTLVDGGSPPAELLAARRRHIGAALSVAYREPLKIVRGAGQYLYDHAGRPYLDLVNNVCHVGHCHPHVVAAGQRQMALLNTNTRYLYDGLTEYAERLSATLPDPLEVCFFVNSGSEANELALRLIRCHTGRRDLLVVDGAYHGHTGGLIAISPYKFMAAGGTGAPESWVHIVPMADGYRGPHKGLGGAAGRAYGDEVGRVIEAAAAPVSGFIVESLLSCGGQIIPPEEYLETAFTHVRAAGGLCVADEVQVGFGRVGTHFWGFELQRVIPDIVVMGKPIGNGHPLSAVVTTREIADSFDNGMEFFSTFGGNPVSCAIGMAVLDVVEEECLQEHALRIGGRLRDGLLELATRHPIIGQVRGAGLFLGVELVRDHDTLEPADSEATEIVNRMRGRGILLSTDGPLHNVLKIKPPMVLSEYDVEMVVRTLDDELAALQNSL